jgi:hypothetical protein
MRALRRIGIVWSAWTAVGLLGLFVRAVIPAGYMIAAEHRPGFVICSGQSLDLGAQKDQAPSPNGKTAAASCPFAVLQLALDTAPPGMKAPVSIVFRREPVAFSFVAPGLGLAAPPPPSTGPPLASVI